MFKSRPVMVARTSQRIRIPNTRLKNYITGNKWIRLKIKRNTTKVAQTFIQPTKRAQEKEYQDIYAEQSSIPGITRTSQRIRIPNTWLKNYITGNKLIRLKIKRNTTKVAQTFIKPTKRAQEKEYQDEQSPIQWNMDILESLISFLDVKSLKQARLVSNDWNIIATKLLGKQTVLQSRKGFQGSNKLMRRIMEPRSQRMRRVVDVHYDSMITQSETKSSLFINWKFHLGTLLSANMIPLLQKCGQYLKSLTIEYIMIERKSFSFVHRILIECPNLKILGLSFVQIGDHSDNLVPTFNQPLKNMEEININGTMDDFSTQFTLSIATSSPKLRKVRILGITFGVFDGLKKLDEFLYFT